MKLLFSVVVAFLAMVSGSIISFNPITPTYVGPSTPVATSYQVVSRNVNRILVPQVPTVATTAVAAYPGYANTWAGYPYGYRGYGYAGYGYPYSYNYPYGYAASVW